MSYGVDWDDRSRRRRKITARQITDRTLYPLQSQPATPRCKNNGRLLQPRKSGTLRLVPLGLLHWAKHPDQARRQAKPQRTVDWAREEEASPPATGMRPPLLSCLLLVFDKDTTRPFSSLKRNRITTVAFIFLSCCQQQSMLEDAVRVCRVRMDILHQVCAWRESCLLWMEQKDTALGCLPLGRVADH